MNLRAEAYDLTVEFSGIHYARTCLIDSRLPWRWMGVLKVWSRASHDPHSHRRAASRA
jgi:hypothetical protein